MRALSRDVRAALALAALTGATVAVLAAVAADRASADATIPINPGNVPTTAAGFDTISCDNLTPVAGKDGWLFVLAGPQSDGDQFVSVTAQFSNGASYSVPPDGMLLTNGSNPDFQKATLYTPAGLQLTAASAVITTVTTSPPTQFQLSHACPGTPVTPSPSQSASQSPSSSPSASGSTSPSPSASQSASPSPSGSASPSDSPSPSASQTASGSPSPSASSSGSASPSISVAPHPGGGRLPTTGLALGGLAVTGLILLAVGLAARAAARRRTANE